MHRVLNCHIDRRLVLQVLRRMARVPTRLHRLLTVHQLQTRITATLTNQNRQGANRFSTTNNQHDRYTRRTRRHQLTQAVRTRRYRNFATHSNRQRIVSGHPFNQEVTVNRVQSTGGKIHRVTSTVKRRQRFKTIFTLPLTKTIIHETAKNNFYTSAALDLTLQSDLH